MKIALLGASGMIGQRIVQEAMDRGHEVTALTRDPAHFPLADPRLTIAPVDLSSAETTARAIAGADVVVNATGDKSASARSFFLTSTHTVIDAVRRAGGPRLIVVGGAGSLEVAPGQQLVDSDDFPAAYRPLALAQRETLDLLRASDIQWTFFSPSALIEPGRRTGRYRLGTDSLLTNGAGESYLSAEDYAVALLDEIEHPQFIRQRFTAVSLER